MVFTKTPPERTTVVQVWDESVGEPQVLRANVTIIPTEPPKTQIVRLQVWDESVGEPQVIPVVPVVKNERLELIKELSAFRAEQRAEELAAQQELERIERAAELAAAELLEMDSNDD